MFQQVCLQVTVWAGTLYQREWECLPLLITIIIIIISLWCHFFLCATSVSVFLYKIMPMVSWKPVHYSPLVSLCLEKWAGTKALSGDRMRASPILHSWWPQRQCLPMLNKCSSWLALKLYILFWIIWITLHCPDWLTGSTRKSPGGPVWFSDRESQSWVMTLGWNVTDAVPGLPANDGSHFSFVSFTPIQLMS